MGKPFKQELSNLNYSIEWSNNLDISKLKMSILLYSNPIYFVGSGGSLSVCNYGVSLASKLGRIAKAVTPLELYSLKNTIHNSSIIIISSSGNNKDILFAFKESLKEEPNQIICICLNKNSKLKKLVSGNEFCDFFEFENPLGKDGFLATNSLLALFNILRRSFSLLNFDKPYIHLEDKLFHDKLEAFSKKISNGYTLLILFGPSEKSIAIGYRIKCSEAALFPT
ncbi:MAG: SIS domain-containing protein [Saprospiraceae bacterium]